MARTATATVMEPARKKESQQPTAPRKKETNGKKEAFSFFAPSAETVMLVGDFTGWEKSPVTLKKQKDGSWKAIIPLEEGEHEYRFLVDGQWQDDTQCPDRRPNGFGQQNCIRIVR
jgi:1,4-alpha-glucan branching enzyme